VIPAFATGLDSRPAIDEVLHQGRPPIVDAVVSLTGFSLVGGPAYNDAKAAEEMLAKLDVPYLAAQPVEFQTLDQWGARPRPAAGRKHHHGGDPRARRPPGRWCSAVARGRQAQSAPAAITPAASRAPTNGSDMRSLPERALMLAARVDKLVALRAPSAPSARWRWCSSTSRPMPATPARPPTCRCSNRCTTRCSR
jgi:magnesium chelatase subunit H